MSMTTELARRMKGQAVKAPYYLAECTHCGEMYPSNLLNGGEPLFAGDYNDCSCPHCNTDDSLIADLGAGEETAVAAWNFQQKRIDSLVEALEAAEHKSAVDWEAAASLNVENVELKQRIAELEARTVKLPEVRITIAESKLRNLTYQQLDAYNAGASRAVAKLSQVLAAAGVAVEGEQ